ncbi:MAG: GtrA family protein [Pseudomonadota bacterium]
MRQQLIYFTLVGACGFVVDAALLQTMLWLGAGPITARFVSFPAAALVTWTLHRKFTFAHRRSDQRGQELGRYLGAQIFSAMIGFGSYALLVLNVALFHTYPLLALVVSAVFSTVSNFLLSHFIVFSQPSRAPQNTPE